MPDNIHTFINKFGYSEMYQWTAIPQDVVLFGKVVQFDTQYPYLIRLAQDENNIVGITTINSVIDSDNPDHWAYQNVFNEYGDVYLRQTSMAVASKEYDDLNELSYMRTHKQDILEPITNKQYDPTQQYTLRSMRREWIRVNLLGKCILEDNGECKQGEYCKLYTGDDPTRFGTVVPASPKYKGKKWYIMNRISNKTILVFNK